MLKQSAKYRLNFMRNPPVQFLAIQKIQGAPPAFAADADSARLGRPLPLTAQFCFFRVCAHSSYVSAYFKNPLAIAKFSIYALSADIFKRMPTVA
jgi:hypothetical protein